MKKTVAVDFSPWTVKNCNEYLTTIIEIKHFNYHIYSNILNILSVIRKTTIFSAPVFGQKNSSDTV